ncbi:MAG: ABC transporter substrate-binding protein [Myxococcota bacterium]
MRHTRVAQLVLAALFCAGQARAGRPRVVVVKSSQLAAYTSVVAGFSAEVRGEVTEVVLEEGAGAAAKTFEKIASDAPALVLAIGPAAANGAKRAFTQVPVIFAMVPYYEKYGLEGPKVTGIALTSDLSVELETLKAVAPGTRRVGVLEDPRYSAKVVREAQEAATRAGLTVVPLEVDSAAKTDKTLEGARGKVDALLMVVDKTVGNAAVVKKLIAFSEEQKIPLVGLSASQVKEGATFSLSPSHTGIGQQAGRLANRILHERVDPGALAVAQPEVLELAMNLSAAKRLGSACDVALEIFKFAAGRGYPIKVYE